MARLDNHEETELYSCGLSYCSHVPEINLEVANLIADINGELALQSFFKYTNVYLSEPFLLDPYIGTWVSQLSKALLDKEPDSDTFRHACAALYQLCKVRGCKFTKNFFPLDVAINRKILHRLVESLANVDGFDWTVRYALFVWCSTIILSPFPIDKLAGNVQINSTILYASALPFLAKNCPERNAAILFLSKFLKRSDCSIHLAEFLCHFQNLEHEIIQDDSGLFLCLSHIVQHIDPAIFRQYLVNFESINNLVLSSSSSSPSSSQLLTRAQLKYQKWLMIRLIKEGYEQAMFFTHVLSRHYELLGHKDNAIRWCAAKGLAQLYNLSNPSELIQSVFDTIANALAKPVINVELIHGCALFIAEIVKRGSWVCPQSLLPITLELLVFEVSKGTFGTGSNVRDAACYISWAWARSKLVDADIVNQLGCRLIILSLFDREVSIRKAAAAAFQELVGRHGCTTGVDLITIVNFFTVGQRRDTFTKLCPKVLEIGGKFYESEIINHLQTCCVPSWDKNTRILASESLEAILPHIDQLNRDAITKKLLTNLKTLSDNPAVCHGTYLALSKLTSHSLSESEIVEATQFELTTKTLGWELVAEGWLLFVQSMCVYVSEVCAPIDKWLETLKLILNSRFEKLHKLAAETLGKICATFSASQDALHSNTIALFIRGTLLPGADKDPNMHVQQSYTLSIGSMPVWLFWLRKEPVCNQLIRLATSIAPVNLIEKRCNALYSIKALVEAQSARNNDSENDHDTIHKSVFECIIQLMTDWSIDACGDVGSLVREAAMKTGLALFKTGQQLDWFVILFAGKLIQQACEKLDRLRTLAVSILSEMAVSPLSGHIPYLDAIANCLELKPPSFAALVRHESYRDYAFLGWISASSSPTMSIADQAFSNLAAALEQANEFASEFFSLSLTMLKTNDRFSNAFPIVLGRLACRREWSLVWNAQSSKTLDNIVSVLIALAQSELPMVRLITVYECLQSLQNYSSIANEHVEQVGKNHQFPRIRRIFEKDGNTEHFSGDLHL